jgi:hypothetical protein
MIETKSEILCLVLAGIIERHHKKNIDVTINHFSSSDVWSFETPVNDNCHPMTHHTACPATYLVITASAALLSPSPPQSESPASNLCLRPASRLCVTGQHEEFQYWMDRAKGRNTRKFCSVALKALLLENSKIPEPENYHWAWILWHTTSRYMLRHS